MNIEVFTEDMQGFNFYGHLGRYFVDRKILDEMDEPFYNEKGSVWFVGFDENRNVIGFCTLFENRRSNRSYKSEGYIYFDNFYIVPEYRKNGYSKELFSFRMDYVEKHYKDKIIEAITRDERQLKNYISHGFEDTGRRGRYHILRKELKE